MQRHDALKLRSAAGVLDDIFAKDFAIAVEFVDRAEAELIGLVEVLLRQCGKFANLVSRLGVPLLNRALPILDILEAQLLALDREPLFIGLLALPLREVMIEGVRLQVETLGCRDRDFIVLVSILAQSLQFLRAFLVPLVKVHLQMTLFH